MFNKLKATLSVLEVTPKDKLYYKLGKIKGNRKTRRANVARIRKSMQKRNWLNCIPIIVDMAGRIIDGQHRYEAAVSLGIPISIIVVEDEDVGSIAIALNTNKSNWTLNNFAHYWAEQEDDLKIAQLYQKYLEYYKANRVTHGVLIAIFNLQTSRHFSIKDGGNKEFKEGRLPYGTFNELHIQDTLSKLRKLGTASLYRPIHPRTMKKQQFQEALLQALAVPCFDFDKFLSNLCRTQHTFNMLAKKSDMYDEIIRIEKKSRKACP
jgi:hypothetical protein